MITTDMGKFSSEDFEALVEAAQSKFATESKGTFRLNPYRTYGLDLPDNYRYGVSITLLNRNAEIVRNDRQLYPFTRLHVIWDKTKPHFRESAGAQVRDKRGILKDWYDGMEDPLLEGRTRSDVFSGQKTPEAVMPTDLYEYFAPLEWINDKVREDQYGRTPPEQDNEKLNEELFEQETGILLQPARDRAAGIQRFRERYFGHRHTRFPVGRRLHERLMLPNNQGVGRIDEEKKGRFGLGTETVVYIHPSNKWPNILEIKRRDADGRLGLTRYENSRSLDAHQGYENNPLDMWEGLGLLAILNSLHNQ